MRRLLWALPITLLGSLLYAGPRILVPMITVTETDGSPESRVNKMVFGSGQVSINGTTATVTITGGGGGSSSLEVLIPGVVVSSPTGTINLSTGSFKGSVSGSSITVSVDPSSVTMLGPNPDHGSLSGLTDDDHPLYGGSNGVVNGCSVSDNGDGTIDVSSGVINLRTTNFSTATLQRFIYDGDSNKTLTSGKLNYVYLQYNGSSATISITTTATLAYSHTIISTVYSSGTALSLTPVYPPAQNTGREAAAYNVFIDGLRIQTGGIVAETGTRNLTVSAAVYWLGLNRGTLTPKDTSASSVFEYWRRDGTGGWIGTENQTQIDNTHYDNNSITTGTLTANRYGVHWVYLGIDDEVYVVMGQGDYTLAEAQSSEPPSVLPPFMFNWHIVLAAKIIIQKSASSFTSIESAFANSFIGATVSDHGALSGLADDDHPQYLTRTDWQTFKSTGEPKIEAAGGFTLAQSTINSRLNDLDTFVSTAEPKINAAGGFTLFHSSGVGKIQGNLLFRTTAEVILDDYKSTMSFMQSSAHVINQSSNPVSWNALKDVPAGFADGTDDGGSGSSDDLGNHVATQPLNMANYPIFNISSASFTGAPGYAHITTTEACLGLSASLGTTYYICQSSVNAILYTVLFGSVTSLGTITSTSGFVGDGSQLLKISSIAHNAVGVPQINASGTPSGTTYLRGDGAWGTIAGGGGGGGSLEVLVPEVFSSSPTSTLNFSSATFSGSVAGATATITLTARPIDLKSTTTVSNLTTGYFVIVATTPGTQNDQFSFVRPDCVDGLCGNTMTFTNIIDISSLVVRTNLNSTNTISGALIQGTSFYMSGTTFTVNGKRYTWPENTVTDGDVIKWNTDGVGYFAADNNSGGGGADGMGPQVSTKVLDQANFGLINSSGIAISTPNADGAKLTVSGNNGYTNPLVRITTGNYLVTEFTGASTTIKTPLYLSGKTSVGTVNPVAWMDVFPQVSGGTDYLANFSNAGIGTTGKGVHFGIPTPTSLVSFPLDFGTGNSGVDSSITFKLNTFISLQRQFLFTLNNVDLLTLDYYRGVGVNNTAPSAVLHVSSNAGTTGQMMIVSTGTGKLLEVTGSSATYTIPVFIGPKSASVLATDSEGQIVAGTPGATPDNGFDLAESTINSRLNDLDTFVSTAEPKIDAAGGFTLFHSSGVGKIQGNLLFKTTAENYIDSWNLYKTTGEAATKSYTTFLTTAQSYIDSWNLFKSTGEGLTKSYSLFRSTAQTGINNANLAISEVHTIVATNTAFTDLAFQTTFYASLSYPMFVSIATSTYDVDYATRADRGKAHFQANHSSSVYAVYEIDLPPMISGSTPTLKSIRSVEMGTDAGSHVWGLSVATIGAGGFYTQDMVFRSTVVFNLTGTAGATWGIKDFVGQTSLGPWNSYLGDGNRSIYIRVTPMGGTATGRRFFHDAVLSFKQQN